MTSTSAWPPLGIRSLEVQLNTLTEAVRNPPGSRTDDEHIWLTRFLLLRAFGYLEQVFFECYREHIWHKSYGTVRNFSSSYLSKSQNPTVDNLLNALGRLDLSLRQEFEDWIDEDDQSLRRALSFAVDRRHKIAHGHNEGVGEKRVLELVSILESVADWIIRKLNPHPEARPSRQIVHNE
ncbi:hypothetical protein KIH27_17870 [Mycobacterium sp. M1]|uniref:RiboL-PSP-HEPN domain-containing protein n=1 Tax=Mycolicibacter acidiphilus TaxID=2835306 RepID=A0ABS5RMB7_9MYCO|nr:hypothetical protein [Mycolicibacter acidiphilus]